jgi:hypothetical protein
MLINFFRPNIGAPEVEDMRNQFHILKDVPRMFSDAGE